MRTSSKQVLLASSCAGVVLAGGLWFALRERDAPLATSAFESDSFALEAANEASIQSAEPMARNAVETDALDAEHRLRDVLELDRAFVVGPKWIGFHETSMSHSVSGQVVDLGGRPVEHAEVSLSFCLTKSGSDGEFQLWCSRAMLEQLSDETPLIARRSGLQPALIENYGARVNAAPLGTLFERIVLGQELAISGRFVDAQGRVATRGRVSLVDGTPRAPGFSGSKFLEPAAQSFDSAAGFEIRGLLPRSYVLECELHLPLCSFRTAPIPAGSKNLELRIPSDALIERVHGYVLTPDGSSLAGAKLDLAFPFAPNVWWPRRSQLDGKPVATTAHGGAFELRDVPSTNAWVVVEHPSIVGQALPLAGIDLSREITLTVRRRARLQFEKFDASLTGMTFDVFEPSGSAVPWEPSPGVTAYLNGAVVALDRGRSKPLNTIDGRFTLRLRNERGEPLPRQIEIVAGETLVVRP